MSKKSKKKKNSKKANINNQAMKQDNNKVGKQKTDYNIPTISFKSAFVIMLSAVIATLVAPYILSLIGVSFKLGIIIGNAVLTAFAVSYCRYFIETKRGYCKSFYKTYIIFAISFAIIGYFWMYLESYI